MATITEDYVSFETAKLLKEKGFDEPIQYFYKLDSKELYRGTMFTNTQIGDKFYNAPTLQMAMKWLREEFDLITYVKLVNDGDLCHDAWGFSIYNKFTNESIKSDKLWFKYEEAAEKAIKYCLENLI